ncbi:MAG: 2'-5' RNA ligase family protein [Candidatus Paceibacterota bacterium]
MFYAIIHRPETDISVIQEVAKKYDPTFELVGPHVTLVFPFSAEGVDEHALTTHIQSVAGGLQPFQARFNELELSWDQWLFLTPTLGKEALTQLHDDLYVGMLQQFLRSDIPFVPHIALGHFAVADSEYQLKDPTAVPLDEERYITARAEIEALKLDLVYEVTTTELISVTDDFSQTSSIATFQLGSA